MLFLFFVPLFLVGVPSEEQQPSSVAHVINLKVAMALWPMEIPHPERGFTTRITSHTFQSDTDNHWTMISLLFTPASGWAKITYVI